MIILALVFCGVLISLMLISLYLRRQTVAFVKLGTLYTNQFMNCELTFEEYSEIKRGMKDDLSPLLAWYMRKNDII